MPARPVLRLLLTLWYDMRSAIYYKALEERPNEEGVVASIAGKL